MSSPAASWSIRIADAGDVEHLVEFNCAIARETEGRELDPNIVRRGVRRGLEQVDEVVYYVADDGSVPIGSLMLTREWSDWRDGWLVWIQSVYVKQAHRGQGVFRSLLEHVMRELGHKPDVVGVRLYVEAENTKAQAVYQRTGFSDPSYKVLEQIF